MREGWDWFAASVSGPNGFWWALVSYVLMILAERVAYLFEGGFKWPERDARVNVINSSVTAVADAILGGGLFFAIYTTLYSQFRLFDWPVTALGAVAAFVLRDLAYYVDHRIAHRTGFFWAFHIPHHSSQEMNLTVSSRGTALALGGVMSPTYFLLALLGLPFWLYVAVGFLGNLWGIFNHTRLVRRMGWLDEILCTPANHRVHHGTEAKYLDRNYGQTLLIWDRLFGTFQREEEEPTYGLVKQLESDRIWDIQTSGAAWLLGQLRSAPRWQDKLRYLAMPPGWRHDGCHQTAEAIRAGQPGCLANPA